MKKVVLYALSAFFIGRTGRRRSPFGRLPREEGKPPEGGFFPSRGPVFGSRPKIPAAPAGAPNKKSRTSRKSRRAKKLWNKQKSSSFCILPQAWKIPGEKLIRMIILSLANKTKNRQPIKKFFKTAPRALLPSLIFEIPTPPERPRLAAYWRRRNILFRQLCRFFDVSKKRQSSSAAVRAAWDFKINAKRKILGAKKKNPPNRSRLRLSPQKSHSALFETKKCG